MKRRFLILAAILAVFLGVLIAMPASPPMKPSRLARELPETFGQWIGKPGEVGEAELRILAEDTDFERMSYFPVDGNDFEIEASIVFSGQNITQSIHRPEVCMRAQGWKFVKETYFPFEDVLPGGEALPVKEIISYRPRVKKEGEKLVPVLSESGEQILDWRASYYTFFGHETIVSGHYQRTIKDVKDRLLKGYSQRWAYATFATSIPSKYAEQGMKLGNIKSRDEEGTREHIRQFLKELMPLVVSAPGKGTDSSIEGN